MTTTSAVQSRRRKATEAVVKKLIFVGECRSLTAQRKGWTWADGRLAAKPLFEALQAMGVDPARHEYTNLWTDNASGDTYGSLAPGVRPQTIRKIEARISDGAIVVALGKRVSAELTRRGVDHVALVHPAARGKIRKRERYHRARQRQAGRRAVIDYRGSTSATTCVRSGSQVGPLLINVMPGATWFYTIEEAKGPAMNKSIEAGSPPEQIPGDRRDPIGGRWQGNASVRRRSKRGRVFLDPHAQEVSVVKHRKADCHRVATYGD